jgi:exodeoxyribonuclease VII large subunit
MARRDEGSLELPFGPPAPIAPSAPGASSAPSAPSAPSPGESRGPSRAVDVAPGPLRPTRPERAAPPARDLAPMAAPVGAPLVAPRAEAAVLSVGELDRRLRDAIEGRFPRVRVEGEVVQAKAVASGHVYFTLKDESGEASIEAVMYRTAPPRSREVVRDGARVVITGQPTVFVPRGRLQLVCERAELSGQGALLEALVRLKRKLADEGLFAPERKRRLPTDARLVGIVTSGDGAVIHDVARVAFRRGRVRILLARAPVQGASAAQGMVRALAMLARVPGLDAIIVGRGGGSADDLAGFNDEALVRAIATMPVPVVSAVGHEVDVALTDLVADARAATPSQAAELLVPDERARRDGLRQLALRLERATRHGVAREAVLVERARRLLRSPERLLRERRQELDLLASQSEALVTERLDSSRERVAGLSRRLEARHPRSVVDGQRARLATLGAELATLARRELAEERASLGQAAARLHALSPLAVLGRGYSLVSRADGALVRSAHEVEQGERVRLRFFRGEADALVVSLAPGDEA